jgi:two-component system, cell cycle response regulator
MTASSPLAVRVLLAGLLAWVATKQTLTLSGSPASGVLLGSEAHHLVQAVAGALCIAGGARLHGRERLAWTLIGAGILAWTAGDAYWYEVLEPSGEYPVPSPADVGYLAFIPFVVAGVALLVRSRVRGASHTLVLDGLTAALAVAAVAAAFVVPRVIEDGGVGLEFAVNLSYPVGDLALLGMLVGAVALNGWRLTRGLALLAAAVLAFWIADTGYLVAIAAGTYESGAWFDVGWPLAMVLFAWSAWTPAERSRAAAREEGLRMVVLPLAFAAVALGVLVVQAFGPAEAFAVALAAASLVAIFARLGLTFRDHAAMLQRSREEAMTDALTGLGNRRALTVDLDEAFESVGDGELVLALFDLDGFKHYNDTFGHPAGDALLARLGRSLADAVHGQGRAYRMGGDEFCVLARAPEGGAARLAAHAGAALSERGEGFAIGCSHGAITLPEEAASADDALRIADQRMYEAKAGGRASASRQSRDVLVQALAERNPDLGHHTADVSALAEDVAWRMGLACDEVAFIGHAGDLHDIGKVAIPDAILDKPSRLDDDEWEFIRRHTVIGERIVAAAPALTRVAPLVRSSHERWDGAGYPDGLAGEAIPLGSRIVAVCDAFDAMTTDRSYRQAMSEEDALAELRRCAGTQFDPAVVDVFVDARTRRRALRAA